MNSRSSETVAWTTLSRLPAPVRVLLTAIVIVFVSLRALAEMWLSGRSG